MRQLLRGGSGRPLALAFGCALFVYILFRLGVANTLSLVLRIGWYFLLIAAIYAAHQLIRAVAYRTCITSGDSGKRLPLDEKDIRHTEDLLFLVLRDRPLRFLSIVTLEFTAQALLVLELFVLLMASGQPFSFRDPFLIEASGRFIGLAFFFIPGQVGAAEGSYALIFSVMGLPAAAGFALAVARRLRSLLTAGAGLALASLGK